MSTFVFDIKHTIDNAICDVYESFFVLVYFQRVMKLPTGIHILSMIQVKVIRFKVIAELLFKEFINQFIDVVLLLNCFWCIIASLGGCQIDGCLSRRVRN